MKVSRIIYGTSMGKNLLLELLEKDEWRWGGNFCYELPTRDCSAVWQGSESATVPGLV